MSGGWSSFVVGVCNGRSYWRVRDLVEGYASGVLLITGRTGTGKSCLLRAAEAEARAVGLSVVRLTAMQFVESYFGALTFRSPTRFLTTLATADLLLIDDVDFLREKPTSQHVLAEVVRCCRAHNGSVVFTSQPSVGNGHDVLPGVLDRAQVVRLEFGGCATREAIVRSVDVAEGLDDLTIARIAEQSAEADGWELHGRIVSEAARRRFAG